MWTSDIPVSIGSPSFSNQNEEISSPLSLWISLFFPNINLNCFIRIVCQQTLYHFEPHKGSQSLNIIKICLEYLWELQYYLFIGQLLIHSKFCTFSQGKRNFTCMKCSMTYCLLSLSRIGRLSSIQSSCYVHKGRKISCAALTSRELIMLRDIFTQDGQ